MTPHRPIGERRNASAEQVPAATLDALAGLPTAILSDNMQGLVGTGLLRPWHRGGRMAGTAVTVRVRAGDNLVLHRALDHVRRGDVLVVDAGGEVAQAVTGKIMLTYLESIGCRGIVINGAVRGTDEIGRKDFPCFARGTTCRGPFKTGPGEYNIPVAIDTLVIAPGDIVVGDTDGLVAFPPTEAGRLITAAGAQLAKEEEGVRAIAQNRWDRSWIAATEAKYGLS
ncbi:RraA family protein [Bosea sp. (in: a-proteobacteria)]|uniref:RraA family protein n=1 Tax=Bosea sp. (in: a-proteobacteria) TaxID=1871050 RepID=UPI00263A3BE4|nr:RraA family protein [Bosea sp. (in: a-proteobacteria)]MCO5092918.1 RraA family protein [Bosea sp. (in: a-proteobacteria)]